MEVNLGRENALLFGVVLLTRTIRFAAFGALSGVEGVAVPGDGDVNGYGGRPSLGVLGGGRDGGGGVAWAWGRQLELVVVCRGEPDPATGYLINIKAIDEGVRGGVLPRIERAIASGRDPVVEMRGLLDAAGSAIAAPVHALTLRMSPTFSITTEAGMERVVTLRQRFEFAAAHRLHAASLSDEENRRFFGKCNNPAGHGHNYVVEPEVAVEVRDDGTSFGLRELERLTMETLIEPFDHKHLNVDTPEFRDGEGLNPTVENIARVFYGLLRDAVSREGRGGSLTRVTVWETDRTSATFPG